MGFTGEEVAGGARPVRLAIDYSERKTKAKEWIKVILNT